MQAAYTYRENVLTSQKSEKNARRGYRFLYGGQEVDNEVYGDYNSYTAEYWQYDPRLGRRWNVDPVPQIAISDYACFKNNPIFNVDIKGAKSDGWIKDKQTNETTWNNDINSQSEFETSGLDKDRYSYVGQDFPLKSGTGAITIDYLTEAYQINNEDELQKGPLSSGIKISFLQAPTTTEGAYVNWMQTFKTNFENYADYANSKSNPIFKDVELIDGTAIIGIRNGSPNPSDAVFYETISPTHTPNNPQFFDMASRSLAGSKEPIYMKFQVSLVSLTSSNNVMEVTVSWGFTIHSGGSVVPDVPKIEENPTPFHRETFSNLPTR